MSDTNTDYDWQERSWNPNTAVGQAVKEKNQHDKMLSTLGIVVTLLSLLMLFKPKKWRF